MQSLSKCNRSLKVTACLCSYLFCSRCSFWMCGRFTAQCCGWTCSRRIFLLFLSSELCQMHIVLFWQDLIVFSVCLLEQSLSFQQHHKKRSLLTAVKHLAEHFWRGTTFTLSSATHHNHKKQTLRAFNPPSFPLCPQRTQTHKPMTHKDTDPHTRTHTHTHTYSHTQNSDKCRDLDEREG